MAVKERLLLKRGTVTLNQEGPAEYVIRQNGAKLYRTSNRYEARAIMDNFTDGAVIFIGSGK